LSRDAESASGRHSGENENPALIPPLSCTGTPEELDTDAGCPPFEFLDFTR